jgi:hypothetical protein
MSAKIGRLPVSFIRKGQVKLKRKSRAASGTARLPFIGGSGPDRCWNIPATGGYFGGYETGEAMAQAYLKMQRSSASTSCFFVTAIVASFMARFEKEGGSEMAARRDQWSEGYESFRGQYVGFFNTISAWLDRAAVNCGSELDRITDDDIRTRANAGLAFDDAAYMASFSDGDAS